jgi:thiol-disulfide isomerase/thioredoxin
LRKRKPTFKDGKQAVILTALLLLGGIAHADGSPKVQKMEMASLRHLIEAKDSRYFIAAMAAWCGPCKEELPILGSLYKRYKSRGFKLIGIALDIGGPAAMQPILDRMKITFPVYWVGEKAVQELALTALPVILIVKGGRITERITGRRHETYLDRKIRAFLE